MPVRVSVFMLSGESKPCVLASSATVRDFKNALRVCGGPKRSRLRIFTTSGSECGDDMVLLDLSDCPIVDLLDPETLKRVLLEVDLRGVVSSDACSVCGASSARFCANCRCTRYCSKECQAQDWREHRKRCERVGSLRLSG